MTFRNFKIASLATSESEKFFNLIESNRKRLEDFFAGTVSKTKTLDDTINYCREIEQKILNKSYFPFVISDLKTDAFIGFIDVKNIDWSIPKTEIGYFIDANYEGQGVITKSLGKVIAHLSEVHQFKKLLCRSHSRNKGSIAVAKKNGFILEGTIRMDYKTTQGAIVDLDYYGRVFS
ncbi:GNAT family N-acetyltransferase [Flavivirga sp. 57AJ16]|uniref:GNAT family N-acetyltransferase n=1 Tax=Flavivirga sp. 57AJ16 TaxID=3025307 RepID=UPI0023670823|nr:GNAT family N-acetyltransferase [Flavivirga sp. 57AJ16]MDD7887771.1 GNAT family N-acetyltransferase [Flavivirga sp. 57AJ16]